MDIPMEKMNSKQKNAKTKKDSIDIDLFLLDCYHKDNSIFHHGFTTEMKELLKGYLRGSQASIQQIVLRQI